jgi:4-hydroxybenzoate polyprenyltransferase
VDKYLLIILMFMIAGMGIAITRDPPVISMFYAMLGGAIIIIVYASMKSRKEQRELRRQKRRSKK